MFLNILEILLLITLGIEIAIVVYKIIKKQKTTIAMSPSVKTTSATNIHHS